LQGIFLLNRYQPLSAQEKTARFLEIGNYENLSHQQTRCIFQDSRELIWIGTNSGLDRWDGSRIKSYAFSPFDSTALNAGIYSITEDNQNNLWLFAGGLYSR
jgi:ligand-binding sensor domain-containing protein